MNRLKSNKLKESDENLKPKAEEGTTKTTTGKPTIRAETPVRNGLLNKITKRYSTISYKLRGMHHTPRKSNSPPKNISGSYDMTGANSEDHRLEIGAPVLVSTTTLDYERLDVSEDRLRQIGGGIAQVMTSNVASTVTSNVPTPQSSPQIPSSGSENEVFVDAISQADVELQQTLHAAVEEELYELAQQTPRSSSEKEETAVDKPDAADKPHLDSSNSTDNSNFNTNVRASTPVNPMSNFYYESTKCSSSEAKLNNVKHSKSALNLHRSELKVFLQRAPSMELEKKLLTLKDLEDCKDLPKLPELFGDNAQLANTPEPIKQSNNSLRRTPPSTPPPAPPATAPPPAPAAKAKPKLCRSMPNTPLAPEDKMIGFIMQQQHFQSVDSLNLHQNKQYRRIFYESDVPMHALGSRNSFGSHNSTIADFDLKSVSCQSLNPQSQFVSIDELNEITRQINEAEDFNREIDLEYCNHRDNLKPDERRITLLKNKNSSRLLNFSNHKKEKLKKGWTGVKHWFGEESTKLREAVHKQATMQRVGASKLNLNSAAASMQGSVLQLAPSHCVDSPRARALNDCQAPATSTDSLQRCSGGAATATSTINSRIISELNVSCADVTEEEELEQLEPHSNGLAELEASFTLPQDGKHSPISKQAKTEGQNGFEELRRYVKQGGDFGKELILILQERIDSEMLYSKSLSKMANKLNKACRELPGSIAEAWRGVATEMESRSDVHRQLSASLTDELIKPLKAIVDGHHKTRKSVESNVDKAARVLSEWRISEAKSKKSSHTAARDNEKLQDAMLDVRIQKSPSIALLHQGANKLAAEKEIKSAEKDCAKLDNKRKKAEEAVKRADVEYYTLCVRAERARVDWEMAVLRGSSVLQNIENQRLVNMKNFASNYMRLTANMNPVLDGVVLHLQPQVDACNVVKDMQVVKNIRRNSEGPSEQLLPDFYCEHTTLAMNRERRKHALIKLLQLVKADLERERRSRSGLKGLSQSLNTQEHQNITDKLYHIRSMLTYLEGARFKLQSALLELDHKPRTTHPLAQHIQITRDRTGLQQSILKVPLWLKNNDKISTANNTDDCSTHDNEHEYDCVSPPIPASNLNLSTISAANTSVRSFSRSKSNMETFSSTTRFIFSNNIAANNKTKTIPSKLEDGFYDRGQADGGSNQHDSDFDEFSSQEEDEEQSNSGRKSKPAMLIVSTPHNGFKDNNTNNAHTYQNSTEVQENGNAEKQQQSNGSNTIVLSRCKALYSYTPKLYDELELSPGDIIEVHAKQEDGWWLGALRNHIGIFPATYVEEFA